MSKKTFLEFLRAVASLMVVLAISVLMAMIVPLIIGLADYNINSFVSFCNGYILGYIYGFITQKYDVFLLFLGMLIMLVILMMITWFLEDSK